MAFMKNEEAVSPVIGVILMVAITVILAAVIAAFVFGMAGNIQKTKIVAAHATQSGNLITVVYDGGQDNALVTLVRATCYTPLGVPNDTAPGSNYFPFTNRTVGATYTCVGSGGQDKVIVVALFNDGSQQTILDTTV
jgi:flagellin-like protein